MSANPELLDDDLPSKRHKSSIFTERHLPLVVIYLMVATLIGFLLAPNIFVTVPSGHVGLLWKRFRGGTQLDPGSLKHEGLRLLWPWDKLFIYDLRLQSTTGTYDAISKDGVTLKVTINTRFRLKNDAIPQLHQGVGPDYIAQLLRPEIGNRAREIISEYTAEEVYSTKRQEIQRKIRTHTEQMLGQNMMVRGKDESEYGEYYSIPLNKVLTIFDTLILGIELPPPIVAAINRKLEQYYLVQEYNFRVEREKKESERKEIEARGISAFQQTVSKGISDSYLRWRGIEATLELAKSKNAKIVIIGGAKDGLPIILGNVDTPAAPNANRGEPRNGSLTPEQSRKDIVPALPRDRLASPTLDSVPLPPNTPEAPPAESETPATSQPPANPGKQSAAPPGKRSSWPFPLSYVEEFVPRILSDSPPSAHQAPKQTTTEHPR